MKEIKKLFETSNSSQSNQNEPFYLLNQKVFPIDPFEFYYSPVYSDDEYDFRHVIIKDQYRKYVPKNKLFTEEEWRGIGIQMSLGWEHFLLHGPEPHILIFRRPKKTQ